MKNSKVKEYYESEAHDYNKEFYLNPGEYPTLRFRHAHILKMVSTLELGPQHRVLDVGCGPGEMLVDLAKIGCEVHGMDIAQEMVEIAQERLSSTRELLNPTHIAQGDIENLTYQNDFFDLIICSGIVEYLKDDTKWLAEITRTLKPNGHLIINVTNKYSIRRWTVAPIEALKSIGFVFSIANFIKEFVLDRGKLHFFPFKPRVHSPSAFDSLMDQHGFSKISHSYFDFALLPAPLDTVLGFALTKIRKSMERFHKYNMKLNGTGYIVHFQKRH